MLNKLWNKLKRKTFIRRSKKHSRKNSGNDSKEKNAHIFDYTTRTTIVNPEPTQTP